MAEFVKVAKEYARLCNSFDNCGECPLNKVRSKAIVCRYWVLVGDPKTAENVILDWAKEHQPVTNRCKFKEIFGFDPVENRIHVYEWLEEEYKEPKND